MTDHPTERLALYQDGELSGEARREVQRHLDTCAECRDALRLMAAVAERVGALRPDPLPPDFTAGVIAATGRPAPAVGSPLRLAALAAALVLGIALGSGWSAFRDRAARGSQDDDAPRFMLVLLEPVAERLALDDAARRERGRLMVEWVASMRQRKILVGGERLRDEEGRMVSRAGVEDRAGRVPAGELFTGYMMIRAASYEEATEVASACPIVGFGGRVAVRAVQ